MVRGALLYEGKSKDVFATDDPGRVILRFSDRATAFNAQKKANVGDKGRINCALTVHLLERVGAAGVRHHLIEKLSDTELLCEKVEIVPLEVVVRDRVAGSLAKRYGLEEGTKLAEPLVELFVKSDALGDPLITDDVAVALGFARRWEIEFLEEQGLAVHAVLRRFWADLGIDLVDAKYEFGRKDGALLLADELTPDGARLWDSKTGEKLDKDVFRRDLGDLGDTYRALAARVFGA
jgi:phosphoribosylaminoimidazole-succinocarboxamide synthase